MNIYTDKNGTEITVGALVRAKGSEVIRRVDVVREESDGKHIHTVRADGKLVSSYQWHKPSTLEIVEEVNA